MSSTLLNFTIRLISPYNNWGTVVRKLLIVLFASLAMPSVATTVDEDARVFGAIEKLRNVQLSPDGAEIGFLAPLKGARTVLMVANLKDGKQTAQLSDVNSEFLLDRCTWKGTNQLICTLVGNIAGPPQMAGPGGRVTVVRTVIVPLDGGKLHEIGQRTSDRSLGYNFHSGTVIDPLVDDPRHVLMAMNVIPEYSTGTHIAETREGLSVQRVDLANQSKTIVEQPRYDATDYITDGRGNTRVFGSISKDEDGVLNRTQLWHARAKNDRIWRKVGELDLMTGKGLDVQAVDAGGDWIIGLKPLDGRQALYRIAADGSGREELLFASDKVDVDGVLQIGKYGRPVAAEYTLDSPEYHYFDPALARLSAGLAHALPDRPIVHVMDESGDGAFKLVYALSANAPGKYYRYDTATHHLEELLATRPELDGRKLGAVRVVSYPAADGVSIPGYLTLPPGTTDTHHLPAILLPHGGPGARDSLGFDWLAQFFASRGYAVLQPNFRGSAGYGDRWFAQNGFQSWRTAIGDVNAGARWLIAQGIADKSRLGIFGWSYGGYAALQANVADPGLYRAAVAVAPVTDLPLLKEEAERYTNEKLTKAYIGDGPHLIEGSPARNAARIIVPVLIFHGDIDYTVDLAQSRRMISALKSAHKVCDLVVYPGLDHQLADGDARADMLRRSAVFFAEHMGGGAPTPAGAASGR